MPSKDNQFLPLEAHSGRKANTLLSNISTEPNPNTLTYGPILDKYLDLETVRWDELISDEQGDDQTRSDVGFEKQRDHISKDARKRCNKDPDKEPRIMPHSGIGLPVPRTEASLTLKLAKKEPKLKTSKNSLDGLYEVLAPGSSVIKSNDPTSVIKEPGKRDVTFRNSDLAKFGTKAERQTDLKCYAERRLKIPMGKTTEESISRHVKDAKRKVKDDKKIKHRRINDDTSCVSSIHSNVSRALRLIIPSKPKKIVVPAPPKPPSETTTDFALSVTLPHI